MNLLDFVTLTNKRTRKFHNDGGRGLRHYCIICTHTAPRPTDLAHECLNCASAMELGHLCPTHNDCNHCDIKHHPLQPHLSPCFSMFTAQWPYWHYGSSANTPSLPHFKTLELTISFACNTFSPDIWMIPSCTCSYLHLDVTSAEMSPLTCLVPLHPCSFTILLPRTFHLWVDLFIAHCLSFPPGDMKAEKISSVLLYPYYLK